MNPKKLTAIAVALVLVHIIVFGLVLKTDPGLNIILFLANGFFLAVGLLMIRPGSETGFNYYLLGYFLLFMFFFVILDQPLLFIIFIFVYAALFRHKYLLGYLFLYMAAILFFRPYSMQAFILMSIIYAISYHIYRKTRSKFLLSSFVIGAIALFFIILPIFYIVSISSPQTMLLTFKEERVRQALFTSLFSSTIATLIVFIFGLPLAYAMARGRFFGKEFFNSLIDIPILIPQSVVGIAILLISGHKTPMGKLLDQALGIEVGGTLFGIIAAQVFVSSPFFIRTAIATFESIDQRIENVARTLGASPVSAFFRVVLPLSANGLFTGCILAWSRSISEFGSVMLIAYHPMTLPVLSYDKFIQFGISESRPSAVLMLVICLWIFIALRLLRVYSPGGIFRFLLPSDLKEKK
jgi:molybdate/tungstate transport system permease protein